MTDERDASLDSADADASGRKTDDGAKQAESDNIQSLTDFFDQMDRAAFKRALANRDAHRDPARDPEESPKTLRR